jgi:hypothetical protein
MVLTDPTDLPFLQRAQQLDLQRRGHFTHLVEQQGASIGRFEQPGAVVNRAGKRTPSVTKEFAFKERVRQRATVDRDKRTVFAWGGVVNKAGQAFLADAAFAEDQDR